MYFSLFLIALALSMDAFAVSICKGLSLQKKSTNKAIITGLWFGGFQALMPLIGFFLGSQFESYITSIDHWIAFVLLSIIGLTMIKESFSKEPETTNDSFAPKEMFVLAIATSIDALAVGVTFAFLQYDILPAITMIGLTTFTLSLIGVKAGNLLGNVFKSKAEFLGGAILIIIGFKILIEHLFF